MGGRRSGGGRELASVVRLHTRCHTAASALVRGGSLLASPMFVLVWWVSLDAGILSPIPRVSPDEGASESGFHADSHRHVDDDHVQHKDRVSRLWFGSGDLTTARRAGGGGSFITLLPTSERYRCSQ